MSFVIAPIVTALCDMGSPSQCGPRPSALLRVLRLLPLLHGEGDALVVRRVGGKGHLVGFTAPREHMRSALRARPALLAGLLPRLALPVGAAGAQAAVVGGRQAGGAADEPVLVVVVDALDLAEL